MAVAIQGVGSGQGGGSDYGGGIAVMELGSSGRFVVVGLCACGALFI